MFDYDAIIIGGGPAGLTAGIYLTRAGYRVLLLEKESFGGQLKNIEWVENYPGFVNGVSGADLAAAMTDQASRHGLQMELREVEAVESFSACRSVTCSDGNGYTSHVIVVAGGSKPRRLGVPGEETFRAKGVIECALCDGGRFASGTVAVCGGGDSGLTEALYLAKLASKVILIEAEPYMTASSVLQERTRDNRNIEVRCAARVVEIVGDDRVRAVDIDVAGGGRERLTVDGVLVHIGIDPNTAYLEGVVPLDDEGFIKVRNRLETEIAYIFAAGDIRAGSPGQIAAAVGDGAIAAIAAQRTLQLKGAND
jgi:thioredoxin reductase (NADPH)